MASLYASAVLLLITGRIRISTLCSFNWALRLGGGVSFISVVLSGVYLQLDCSPALPYVLILEFFSGVLGQCNKVTGQQEGIYIFRIFIRVMITMVFPLSAWVTIAFSVVNFLLSSFSTYNCLFCSMLAWLVELMICSILY